MKKFLVFMALALFLTGCDQNQDKEKSEVYKDLVLSCAWYDQTIVENNRSKKISRNEISNPKFLDGYIHYNFKERTFVSDLSHMSRYGKIYEGKNLSKKINLTISSDSQTITFFITYGIITDSMGLNVPFEQNSFSIDKYTNRMTASSYRVGKPNGDRVIINYNCNQIEKPKY